MGGTAAEGGPPGTGLRRRVLRPAARRVARVPLRARLRGGGGALYRQRRLVLRGDCPQHLALAAVPPGLGERRVPARADLRLRLSSQRVRPRSQPEPPPPHPEPGGRDALEQDAVRPAQCAEPALLLSAGWGGRPGPELPLRPCARTFAP